MSVRKWVLGQLLKRVVAKRKPDIIIGGEDNPYLLRWYVIPRNRFFNIYFHHFRRSDEDRALHDHPWISMSWLLDGSYIEHQPNGVFTRPEGHIGFRKPSALHRVELLKPDTVHESPVWTIFLTGPKVREWGFACPQGWRHWRDFCDPKNPGEVGRGCD